MKNKNLKLPLLILAIGLALAVVSCFLTGVVLKPTVTEQDFHFSVTYTLNGETKTIEGTYRCEYTGHGAGAAPLERFYNGVFVGKEAAAYPGFPIAQEDDLVLCIEVIFSDYNLMGDTVVDDWHEDPYLVIYDVEGYEYYEAEVEDVFDASIVDWEYPEPVENSFVFDGFSYLHVGSMFAMAFVGFLTMLACLIFVKRDPEVSYQLLDIVSIVFNFLVGLVAVPFILFLVWLMQITVSEESFMYQMYLCLPALTLFTIAASIALRRKGFSRIGFAVPFVGPGIFAVTLIVESMIYNLGF